MARKSKPKMGECRGAACEQSAALGEAYARMDQDPNASRAWDRCTVVRGRDSKPDPKDTYDVSRAAYDGACAQIVALTHSRDAIKVYAGGESARGDRLARELRRTRTINRALCVACLAAVFVAFIEGVMVQAQQREVTALRAAHR